MSSYQIRTLPGGRTYGLYEVDSKKWVSPSGKTDAVTPHGAKEFFNTEDARNYRALRGFDYSKNYENTLIAEANLIFDPRDSDTEPQDEYLTILREREAKMDEMFSPEYQKSLYPKGFLS
jgi:hypothetical protein